MQTYHVCACVCECGYVAILLRRILFAQTDNIFAVALKRPYKELLPVYVRAYICMSILFVCVCVCMRVCVCHTARSVRSFPRRCSLCSRREKNRTKYLRSEYSIFNFSLRCLLRYQDSTRAAQFVYSFSSSKQESSSLASLLELELCLGFQFKGWGFCVRTT